MSLLLKNKSDLNSYSNKVEISVIRQISIDFLLTLISIFEDKKKFFSGFFPKYKKFKVIVIFLLLKIS